jgi:hypothetical protein
MLWKFQFWYGRRHRQETKKRLVFKKVVDQGRGALTYGWQRMLRNNFVGTIRESDLIIRRRQISNWLNKKCKAVASSNSNDIAEMDISLIESSIVCDLLG